MTARLFLIFMAFTLLLGGSQALAQDDEPPRADEYQTRTDFLACRGNGYALCYYSGPSGEQPTKVGTTSPPLPCNPNISNTAACTCYALPDGRYQGEQTWNYVEVGSILNETVRELTIARCGETGERCLNLYSLHHDCREPDGVIAARAECEQAPVCGFLGNPAEGVPQTLYPELGDAVLISTFSFAYRDVHELGTTDCTQLESASYAGCMTAPCRADENGLTSCECPVYQGPYQVGQSYPELQCTLDAHIWSAAYHETSDAEE